jgi:predicted DNA-binding WGR domain protein
VAGSDVVVRFGRLGTDGQLHVKSFATAEAAHRHAEKLIAQKAAKGYVECAIR